MLKILEVLRKGWDDDLMGVTRSGGDWKGRWLPSITLLSIFLLSGTIFRNILGRGVERPIVAAEH